MWKCPVCGVLNEEHERMCVNCFSARKVDPASQTPPAQPAPQAPPANPVPPAYACPPGIISARYVPPTKEKKAWPLVLGIILVLLVLAGLIFLLLLVTL